MRRCLSCPLGMMIMSMGWDYVSELRPPVGLLFISRGGILYNHGKPWWNAVDRGNLVATRRNGQRKWRILALQSFLLILASDFWNAVKSYDMGPTALLPIRRKACCGFLSPRPYLNPRTLNLGSNGKHANRYTTEATVLRPSCNGTSFRILVSAC
jgi:hypothetical protein